MSILINADVERAKIPLLRIDTHRAGILLIKHHYALVSANGKQGVMN